MVYHVFPKTLLQCRYSLAMMWHNYSSWFAFPCSFMQLVSYYIYFHWFGYLSTSPYYMPYSWLFHMAKLWWVDWAFIWVVRKHWGWIFKSFGDEFI